MFIWQNNALTRAERIARILPTAGILAFAVLIIADSYASRPVSDVLRYEAFGALLLASIGILILKRFDRRARKLILAGDVRVCPSCCYSLAGLDDSGPCPECGVPYSPESLRQRWAIQYNLWELVTAPPATHESPQSVSPPRPD